MIQYKKLGYTVLRQVFDPLKMKRASSDVQMFQEKTSFIYEDDGTTIRSIFSPHQMSDGVMEFVIDNPVIPTVKEILGNDIYLHQCHFNYKTAQSGGEYAWHSDYTFWHHDDGMPNPNAVSCLFLLDEMTIDNGPLEVLEGSHSTLVSKEDTPAFQIKHDSSETNGMITEDMVSKTGYKRHTVLGHAGDVILMHANLWHASSANNSDKDRNILFVCYNRLDNKITKMKRPTYISSRDFTPIP